MTATISPALLQLVVSDLVAAKPARSTAPVMKFYRSCDPSRSELVATTIVADCLEPQIAPGTRCWFEAGGAWSDGDLVQIFESRAGRYLIKQMHRMADGFGADGTRRSGWLMLSNLPPVWLTTRHQVIGPLVASLHGLPLPAALEPASRHFSNENAAFRRLAAQARKAAQAPG